MPTARPQKMRIREQHRAREVAAVNQLLRAVEIGEHRIQQRRALDDGCARCWSHSCSPMSSGIGSRGHGRSLPCGIAVDVIRDAVVLDQMLAGAPALVESGGSAMRPSATASCAPVTAREAGRQAAASSQWPSPGDVAPDRFAWSIRCHWLMQILTARQITTGASSLTSAVRHCGEDRGSTGKSGFSSQRRYSMGRACGRTPENAPCAALRLHLSLPERSRSSGRRGAPRNTCSRR